MLNFIDISMISALYIYIFCFLAGFVFMGVLYFFIEDRKKDYLYFFLFFVFCLSGAFIVTLRNEVGDFLGVIVANGLLVLGHLMIPLGIRMIFKQKIYKHAYVGVLMFYSLFFIYGTFMFDNTGFRIYVLNFIIILILIYALVSIQQAKKSRHNMKEVLSISIYAVIVGILLRISSYSIYGEDTNDFLLHRLDSLFIILIGICNLFIIPGLLSVFRAIQEDKLRNLSRIDSLTGLDNRRSLIDTATKVTLQCKREKLDMSIFMIDIDDFKKYNDQFGHTYGDKILIDVANVLRNNVYRPLDIVSRYGGDEFVIVMYDCSYESAKMKALDIVEKVKELPHKLLSHKSNLTVSVGYVTVTEKSDLDLDDLIHISDEKMYQAKQDSKRNIIGASI